MITDHEFYRWKLIRKRAIRMPYPPVPEWDLSSTTPEPGRYYRVYWTSNNTSDPVPVTFNYWLVSE